MAEWVEVHGDYPTPMAEWVEVLEETLSLKIERTLSRGD